MRASIVRYLVVILTILNIAVSVAAETRPTPAAKATAKSVESPDIRVVDIRRTTGPWEAIVKSEEGGYLSIDKSGNFSAVLPERDVTGFAILNADSPRKAAILLLSLEEAIKRARLVFQPMRALEAALGYKTLSFELPKAPPRNPWGQIDGAQYDDSGDEYILSFLTTEAELAEKFRSVDIEDRRLALSAFLKIRGSVSNKLEF